MNKYKFLSYCKIKNCNRLTINNKVCFKHYTLNLTPFDV